MTRNHFGAWSFPQVLHVNLWRQIFIISNFFFSDRTARGKLLYLQSQAFCAFIKQPAVKNLLKKTVFTFVTARTPIEQPAYLFKKTDLLIVLSDEQPAESFKVVHRRQSYRFISSFVPSLRTARGKLLPLSVETLVRMSWRLTPTLVHDLVEGNVTGTACEIPVSAKKTLATIVSDVKNSFDKSTHTFKKVSLRQSQK